MCKRWSRNYADVLRRTESSAQGTPRLERICPRRVLGGHSLSMLERTLSSRVFGTNFVFQSANTPVRRGGDMLTRKVSDIGRPISRIQNKQMFAESRALSSPSD